MARLGALAELDLDHLDLGIDRLAGEFVGVEVAVRCAAPEVTRCNLPDQVAAVPAVIGADGALAGVMSKFAKFCALVEGQYGVGAHRAETRSRNVENGRGIRLQTIGTADDNAKVMVV